MRRATVGLMGLLALSIAPLPVSGIRAGPLGAQETLWLSWIGCWEGAAEVGGDEADSFLVCFQPLTTGAGVEIRTYAQGDLVASEQMLADGAPRALEEGGCTGQRTSGWSTDRARVYLVSELDCGGGVTRSTRGVLSMLPNGEGWVEVQAVQAGDAPPLVGIRTFVPATESLLEQDGIVDPAEGRELAVRSAQVQAGGTLTPEMLAEAVERVGPSVTNALLIERGEPFGLDREVLKALSARGVPGEVLDVMVAVSYPERFELAGTGADVNPEMRSPTAAASSSDWPRRRSFRGYSPWGLGYDLYWDPFWSSAYRFGYGGYGYNSYGYGSYGYGAFGPSIYRQPRLIFVQPPTVQSRGATLSRNRGVVGDGTRSARSSGGSRAAPSRSRSSSESRAAPSSGSSSGSSRAAPSSSSSGGSSGSVRRARPRNDG